jgi:hypothetical protein
MKKKSNYLIGNRTGDLPTCSTVPQPTTLPSEPWNSDDNPPKKGRHIQLFIYVVGIIPRLHIGHHIWYSLPDARFKA